MASIHSGACSGNDSGSSSSAARHDVRGAGAITRITISCSWLVLSDGYREVRSARARDGQGRVGSWSVRVNRPTRYEPAPGASAGCIDATTSCRISRPRLRRGPGPGRVVVVSALRDVVVVGSARRDLVVVGSALRDELGCSRLRERRGGRRLGRRRRDRLRFGRRRGGGRRCGRRGCRRQLGPHSRCRCRLHRRRRRSRQRAARRGRAAVTGAAGSARRRRLRDGARQSGRDGLARAGCGRVAPHRRRGSRAVEHRRRQSLDHRRLSEVPPGGPQLRKAEVRQRADVGKQVEDSHTTGGGPSRAAWNTTSGRRSLKIAFGATERGCWSIGAYSASARTTATTPRASCHRSS